MWIEELVITPAASWTLPRWWDFRTFTYRCSRDSNRCRGLTYFWELSFRFFLGLAFALGLDRFRFNPRVLGGLSSGGREFSFLLFLGGFAVPISIGICANWKASGIGGGSWVNWLIPGFIMVRFGGGRTVFLCLGCIVSRRRAPPRFFLGLPYDFFDWSLESSAFAYSVVISLEAAESNAFISVSGWCRLCRDKIHIVYRQNCNI